MKGQYNMRTKVWVYQGPAAWHFVTIPKNHSADIKKKFGANARGWGSLRVAATVGKTTWNSSIFPDKKSGTYLLPLKLEVRTKEGLVRGDTVALKLVLK